MRAIWKGSIAFGLVHIPVNLYPATESQSTVSSNLLHKKDHSRIRYQRVSEATGKEVPVEEVVRGFEVERDNFVVISDDELKEAAPEKSAAIEIQESSLNHRSRPFILKSRTIWSRIRAPAKLMPYCAKRSPNPEKSVSRNSCYATAKASAY